MKLFVATILAFAFLSPCPSIAMGRIMDTWKRVQIATKELEISAATNSVGDKLRELRIKKRGGSWVSLDNSILKSIPWPQLQTLEVEAFCREKKCSSLITLIFTAETDLRCTYGNRTECSSASFEFDGKSVASFKTYPPYRLIK